MSDLSCSKSRNSSAATSMMAKRLKARVALSVTARSFTVKAASCVSHVETVSVAKSSPCTGVCKIDKDVCIGCHRTLSEIAEWRSLPLDHRIRRTRELLEADRNRLDGELGVEGFPPKLL